MRIIFALTLLAALSLVGCNDDESVVATTTATEPTDTLMIGNGDTQGRNANDTSVPDPESPDVENPDSTQEGGNEEPCKTGSIRGLFCNPGETADSTCTQLSLSATCSGENFEANLPLAAGGAFVIENVPSGIQTLNVSLGFMQAECTLVVDGGKETLVTINDCDCLNDGDCSSLFSPICWPETLLDDCNCQDDDCDGEIDEDCIDGCDCVDSNCNGVIDEDCLDICDGVDQNCDGFKDEDCPFVNQCLPSPEFTDAEDCDHNGFPDTCPDCPPAEVVFVIDTSGSMSDELDALCAGIDSIQAALEVVNITTTVEILGITEILSCTHDTVVSVYGNIPKDPIAQLPELLKCNSATDNSEDWGTAVAVVAANKQWAEGGIKMVIPISDEAPICGNPLDIDDEHGMDAVNTFVSNLGVLVYPISGTGTNPDVIDLAQALAEATGGLWNETTSPDSDLILHVLGGVFDACQKTADCNDNGLPDTCDIESGASADCDGDGAIDLCTFDPSSLAMDCNQNGVFDPCEVGDESETDCDQNKVLDSCDLQIEGSLDCDQNGLPDSCDVESEGGDCNENGIPDACDIAGDSAIDCDANGIVDTCELATNPSLDCNENQTLDSCDVASDPLSDCDGNGAIDACEIAAEPGLDCNENAAIDACEMAEEPGLDCNENQVLDTCEDTSDPLVDCDGNGAIDSCELSGGNALDCDGNSIIDPCDIASGTAGDCNANAVPDSCELTPDTDTNSDQVLDICQ